MTKEFYCEICGKRLENNKNICDKHAEQIKLWGFPLDTNPRTEYDPNEIIYYEDYAEIVLYDKYQEEIEERVMIDLKDVQKIKDSRWNNKNNCIVNTHSVLLSNFLLNTNNKVKHKDNNYLNCNIIRNQ